jgi:hypothetical protein
MSKEIAEAMAVIKKAMIDDGPSELGSYAHGWHCNIAMACYDAIRVGELPIDEKIQHNYAHAISQDAASRFMKLCFDVETTNNKSGE